jgi:hypothetical protein
LAGMPEPWRATSCGCGVSDMQQSVTMFDL